MPADLSSAEQTAKALLQADFHSALQIANMPKNTFIQETSEIFANDKNLAEQVYQRATACRKSVALKYMKLAQNAEPYARAAGLNR